jgi:hypothetical protein
MSRVVLLYSVNLLFADGETGIVPPRLPGPGGAAFSRVFAASLLERVADAPRRRRRTDR